MTPEQVWIESLQSAYLLARGERLNELRGEHVRRFDVKGLHPFSAMWGRVEAMQALEPLLGSEDVSTSAVTLRSRARADADQEFRAEILEEGV